MRRFSLWGLLQCIAKFAAVHRKCHRRLAGPCCAQGKGPAYPSFPLTLAQRWYALQMTQTLSLLFINRLVYLSIVPGSQLAFLTLATVPAHQGFWVGMQDWTFVTSPISWLCILFVLSMNGTALMGSIAPVASPRALPVKCTGGRWQLGHTGHHSQMGIQQ